MGIPTLSEFNQFVSEIFGVRGASGHQQPTAGMGFLKGQCGLYAVIQSGTVKEAHYDSIDEKWRKKGWDLDIARSILTYADIDNDSEADDSAVIDSSHLAVTKAKKGERTGFHAEMIILSSMISANNWRSQAKTLNNLKALIGHAGGAMIAANAQTCKHCGNLMTRAGIEFEKSASPP